ncbi:hypothetical protein G9A89_004084 [Geosiphon pyriformis]|nr:hypothetical protein G9A89_004084 [Geosiphon pyriformis]
MKTNPQLHNCPSQVYSQQETKGPLPNNSIIPLDIPNWTKSLGEYKSLFGNLTPAASQTEKNLSTWEQPLAQNLAESASPLMEETAILQPIGSSDKGKQSALAPGEHSNTQTPISLNITNNTYSWIADIEKAITANGTAVFSDWNCQFVVPEPGRKAYLFYRNQFSIIKQKDHKTVTTYLRQFNQILHQILAIKRDYYTMVQVLNQFIKGLRSSILRSIRLHHPTSLQDVITLVHDFESVEQEVNHTQAVNLAINGTSDIDTKIIQLSEKLTQKIEGFLAGTTGTYQPPQQRENNNNSRYPQQQQILTATELRKIMNQNQGNPYQQPRYQQNINQLPLYAQQIPYTQPLPQNYYQPPPMTQAIPHYQTSLYSLSRPRAIDYNQRWRNSNNNQVQTNSEPSRPILREDQSFDKSTPMEGENIERISQPSKQTKSNIRPATITKDTTLATIFPFNIDNLNTHSLFSGAAINQDKPIMALYTDARVGGIDIKLILDSRSASNIITKQLIDQLDRQVDHAATARIITADGNTKTPIGEIDNFPFKINGIQIPTKVLVMEATQYQALVGNDWLSKANTTLDWNIQELQLTFNEQHARVSAMCKHFKTQCTEKPLIEFENTSMPPTIKTYQVSWADDYQTELPPPPT